MADQRPLSIGHSPDADDAFMFHALALHDAIVYARTKVPVVILATRIESAVVRRVPWPGISGAFPGQCWTVLTYLWTSRGLSTRS
jgi:hypothetical protein